MARIIINTDDIEFEDKLSRQWLSKLQTQVDSINKRTKSHTLQIREIVKKIKVN